MFSCKCCADFQDTFSSEHLWTAASRLLKDNFPTTEKAIQNGSVEINVNINRNHISWCCKDCWKIAVENYWKAIYFGELLQILSEWVVFTAQKIKFSIKKFFSKCEQIRSLLGIWSHLLKKSLMGNFIFCAMIRSIYSFLWPAAQDEKEEIQRKDSEEGIR